MSAVDLNSLYASMDDSWEDALVRSSEPDDEDDGEDGGDPVTRGAPDQPRDDHGRWTSGGDGRPDSAFLESGVDHFPDRSKWDRYTTEAEALRLKIVGDVVDVDVEPVAPPPPPPVLPPTPPTPKPMDDLWTHSKRAVALTRQIRKLDKERRELKKTDPNHPKIAEMSVKIAALRAERLEHWRLTHAAMDAISSPSTSGDKEQLLLNVLKVEHPLTIHALMGKEPSGAIARGLRVFSQITSREAVGAPLKVRVKGTGGRAFARPGEIHVASYADTGTVMHELAHVMEHQVRSKLDAANAFIRRRTDKDDYVQLNKLIPGARYGKGELARPDKFMSPYSGKFYIGATEATSMGMSYLWEDPVGFARKDPDYFRFTVSQLRRPA